MFAAGKTASSGSAPDAQFNYVTMLLHGDGTNGAQNNTFLDSSTNNFTITRNGNTTQGSFSPYGSNWSNYFDGSSYLTTSSTQIIPTGSFTVECYVFVTGSGNNQKFVSQGSSGAAGRFSLGIEGGNWFVQLGGDLIQTGTPVKNQWNYVATTYNGSTITMYVNGSSIGTVSSTANAQNAALTIGQDWNAYLTTGYISNVRVSNTVRTISTPTSPYTSDANTRLLACQANRFLDSSSNGFAFTVTGSPSVQRFNPFGASTAYSTSVIGGSAYFDGSSNLTAPNNATLKFGTSDFTLEFWLYYIGGGEDVTGTFNGGTSSQCYQIFINGNDVRIRLYGAGGAIWNYGTMGSLKPNTWNHIALTRSGTTFRTFVNGVAGQTTTSSDSLKDYTGNIQIGSSQYYSIGYISDYRIIKGTALYTSAFTPPTAPLTTVTNTTLLTNFTNGAIFDNAMMNDLETVGNAQISTSVKKYGTGSLVFDGNGDYLAGPYSSNLDFGTGDFTVELWFYFNGSVTGAGFIGSKNAEGMDFAFTSNSLRIGRINTAWDSTFAWTPSANTWYHIAFTRSNGTARAFVNGTQVGSSLSNTNNYYPNGGVYVGVSAPPDRYVNGYIDDLRITKGYARYTTTFTPPTKALSDTGP